MIYTSLIIIAVSDRSLYANLPLYTAGSQSPVTRTHRISALIQLNTPFP